MSEDARLAKKPTNMTSKRPRRPATGQSLAPTYLRRADLRKRQRILIYGTSGSLGTAGVPASEEL